MIRKIMYFDFIEEREVNGRFDIYAINRLEDVAFLLKTPVIATSVSSSGELWLKIVDNQNEYFYRGEFQSKEEMDKYVSYINRLVTTADRKSNSIYMVVTRKLP